ncbi:MAG: biotin--[acetyl-CoA-carboxylase] ligase, partial [Dehalococcoidia bacterium]|nr:biotin--[acetyl-CoA-carboxylase] ligase [Dehalococcoidia bacterium]
RSWLSPEGSLAMSVILRPKIQHLPQLVMASSLAVVRTVKENCGLEARIKWPNDVLLNGRKVCGILTESELKGGQVKFAIIGIGLNINMDPLAFPEIAAIATSLSAETGGPVSFEKVTAGLLNNLEHYYLRLRSGEPLIAEWRQNMETIGRKVRVRNNDEVTEGTAEDVTADGALMIRRGDGSLATALAGDVTVVRD